MEGAASAEERFLLKCLGAITFPLRQAEGRPPPAVFVLLSLRWPPSPRGETRPVILALPANWSLPLRSFLPISLQQSAAVNLLAAFL